MRRHTRVEYGWSEASMAKLKVIQNERLIKLKGENIFGSHEKVQTKQSIACILSF